LCSREVYRCTYQLTRLLMLLQPEHKVIHKSNASHNPFPTFSFTGSLRPAYPLSPKRTVPEYVPHPNYAKDADPKYKFVGRNTIQILDKKAQDGMRKVCRLTREVLDVAAREIKPGVTTDQIDEVVHNACIERNVCLGVMYWDNCSVGSLTGIGIPIHPKLCPLSKILMHISQRSHMPWHTRPTQASRWRHSQSRHCPLP